MHTKRIQYTVRGVPAEVDRELRRRAARERASLNQVIVATLTQAALGRAPYADFTDLAGQWGRDARFDQRLAAQRAVDEELWKKGSRTLTGRR